MLSIAPAIKAKTSNPNLMNPNKLKLTHHMSKIIILPCGADQTKPNRASTGAEPKPTSKKTNNLTLNSLTTNNNKTSQRRIRWGLSRRPIILSKHGKQEEFSLSLNAKRNVRNIDTQYWEGVSKMITMMMMIVMTSIRILASGSGYDKIPQY